LLSEPHTELLLSFFFHRNSKPDHPRQQCAEGNGDCEDGGKDDDDMKEHPGGRRDEHEGPGGVLLPPFFDAFVHMDGRQYPDASRDDEARGLVRFIHRTPRILRR
jgi:cytosine/adenosine deaminase-related metal-dependent hydrolase